MVNIYWNKWWKSMNQPTYTIIIYKKELIRTLSKVMIPPLFIYLLGFFFFQAPVTGMIGAFIIFILPLELLLFLFVISFFTIYYYLKEYHNNLSNMFLTIIKILYVGLIFLIFFILMAGLQLGNLEL